MLSIWFPVFHIVSSYFPIWSAVGTADLSACLWSDPVSVCLHAESSALAQASCFLLLSRMILTLSSQEPGRTKEQLHAAWMSQGGAWPRLSQEEKAQDGNSSTHTILMPFADLGCVMRVCVYVYMHTLTSPVVGWPVRLLQGTASRS